MTHPRWALLSVLACVTLVTLGTAAWDTMPCIGVPGLSRLCSADALPGAVQAALVWLAFGAGWLATWTLGAGIHEPRPRRDGREALLRTLSDAEALSPLVVVFGVAGLAAVVAMVVLGRVQPAAISVALLPGAVAVCIYVHRSRQAAVPRTEHERAVWALARRDTPLYRLRSLPLIRYVWPNRPPPGDTPPDARGSRPDEHLVPWPPRPPTRGGGP